MKIASMVLIGAAVLNGVAAVIVSRLHARKAAASQAPLLLDPPPRRVRLRLWRDGKVDRAASCLVEHGQFQAAIALWRAFRLWEA